MNDLTGWAVGDNGTVLHTANGGVVWSAQAVPTAQPLYGVDFVNNSVGWVVGANATILKTATGGTSWVAQTSPAAVTLNSVHFPVDSLTGYAAGIGGTILKTVDGGANWVAQTTPTTNELREIHFPVDALTGYAVGQGGTVLKTTDGGGSWVSQPTPTGQMLEGVHFPSGSSTGWISGRGPTILHTSNGGTNWNAQSSPVAEQLHGVHMIDGTIGFIVGNNGTILETSNGGANWTSDASPTGNHLNATYWPSSATGYAVGNVGTVLKAAGDVSVSGTVFEDIVGDGLDGAQTIGDATNPGSAGVTVRLYSDDGDRVPDGGDTFEGTQTTSAAGAFSFNGFAPGDYWVVVDSSSIAAAAGYNPTYTAASARPEQSYGPAGSWCADASAWGWTVQGIGANGACYGGRRVSFVAGSQSDDLTTWWSGAEHLALVDAGSASVSDVNFGFSFNVVASNQGNTTGAAEQGSFDQFIQNANAVAGPNAMRFVPAGPPRNASGAGNWWRIDVSGTTTAIHDADTTIDGRAVDWADGVTVRDLHTGFLGANALGGVTVGADDVALPQVPRPELQLIGANLIALENGAAGLLPHRFEVYRVSMTGTTGSMIRVNPFNASTPLITGTHVADTVLGSNPATFAGSLPSVATQGVYLTATADAVVENNLIGWTNNRTVDVGDSANAIVRGNELRATSEDTVDIFEGSDNALFEANLVAEATNWGLDYLAVNGTIRNNTFEANGDGVGQSGGLRIFFTGNTVDRNVFRNNAGPGIAVAGEMVGTPRDAGEAVLTRNEFDNNDGLGIDLQPASEDNSLSGDGITPNNGGALDALHGNNEIDFPVLTAAGLTGGTTTVQGTACAGCTVEIYRAVGGTGDDDPPGSGTNYHGEGTEYLGSGVATGGTFSIDVTGLIVGDSVTATATDAGAGVTSEFSQNLAVVAWSTISGRVFEDLAADALAGAQAVGDAVNPAVSGVDVYLYADDGTTPGSPDAGDSVLNGGAPVPTDGTGAFSFASLPNGTYWVVTDSATVSPSAGLEPTMNLDDVWAEQTYGPTGAWCADGAGGTAEAGAAGTCYGGRSGTASDQASALTSAEHLARVVIAGGTPVSNVDFGFSYDVVTTTRGGDATVDPGAAGTQTVQGSLRQFIANANNITGANQMRFVPAVPTNGTDGINNWWRVAVTSALPAITNAFTSIDGTAYQLADGTTVRDDNDADQGAGETVGVDGLYTTPVLDPELELDITGPTNGLLIEAADATVRGIGIWGAGSHDIAVGDDLGPAFAGVLIEQNIVGTPPHRFDSSFAPSGNDLIELYAEATDGIVRDNLIGFSDGGGVSVDEVTGGWLVFQNEIRGIGRAAGWGALQDGVGDAGPGTVVRGNLLVDSAGMGVDSHLSPGGYTVEQNTIRNNGTIAPENAGIRVIGSGSTVTKNLFEQNNGPAIIIVSDDASAPYPGANGNRISQNHFSNSSATADNAGIALDLLDAASPSAEHDAGDGITLNDGLTDPDAGNLGLDYPVITNAFISGGSLVVTGWARPGVEIEFYEAVGTANDQNGAGTAHGEGFSYL
ncbi:MAG: right-handed parallel beta-helix repeat-containing protein, partial [Acidimicrobiia bacterium]|nr:right-handed parallel beta-helix repeat-containing protein [Acidimicrobiia bacterium]